MAFVFSDSGQILFWETALLRDKDIVDVIQKYNDGTLKIAIDAPLVVPNENGSRPCDRLFRKHRVHGHALEFLSPTVLSKQNLWDDSR